MYFLIFGGILAFAAVGLWVVIYNGLVELRQQIERAWANIDVILKQRHDEIGALVQVCEQFARYERATIDRVVQARENYFRAKTIPQKVGAANELGAALHGVFALSEAYPELQSNAQFLQLQGRITALENMLADRRELYNESVTVFNTRIQQIPDVFVASTLTYQAVPLFTIEQSAKKAPSLRMKLPA